MGGGGGGTGCGAMVVGGPPTGIFGTPLPTGGVVVVVARGRVLVVVAGVLVGVLAEGEVVEVVDPVSGTVVVVGSGPVSAGAPRADAHAPEVLTRATSTATTHTAVADRRTEREINVILLAFDAVGGRPASHRHQKLPEPEGRSDVYAALRLVRAGPAS